MKTFNVVSRLILDPDGTFRFTLSRFNVLSEVPIDVLNIRSKITGEDKDGNYTFEIIDGGYAKLTSGKVFNIGTTFKVEKTSHVNKIIINKQTFLRLDVGTQKQKRYETVNEFFHFVILWLGVLPYLQRIFKRKF